MVTGFILRFLRGRFHARLGEDDDACAGLDGALHLRVNLLADVGLGVVDDDHSAVGEVADALAFVAAFADDFQFQNFAGEQRGFHEPADFVQVEAGDALKFGDLGEVEIVGDEAGLEIEREVDELGVHVFFPGKIAVVDADFNFRAVLKAVEHFEAASSTRSFDGIGGIGNLLEFVQHEAGDDGQAFNEFRLDEVGDPAINDHARVEQQQILRFVLRHEPDIRNDERKIFLVAAHGQNHADVTEAQEQAETDEPVDIVGGIHKQAGAVNEHRHTHAEQQAERRGGKSAERKSFEHFIHGDEQAAEAKADHHAENAAVLFPDIFRAHLADGVTAGDAEAEKQKPDGPEWRHGRARLGLVEVLKVLVAGGLCDHKTPQSPTRFKLLAVMERLAASSRLTARR